MSTSNKLHVIYRVEPGCLGPTGNDLVDEFCSFAQKKFEEHHKDMINWEIQPRHDKAMPELQYKINGKILTEDHASRYLLMFDKDLEDFEISIEDLLVTYIDDFMNH